MILSEANIGSIGYVYWMEKTSYNMSEKEIETLRQKNISETLNSTLINMMYEPGKAIQSMDGVIQRGWNEANKQIQMVENGTELKKEIFLIGDPNTIPRLIEIENSLDFRGWTNPYLVEQIKEIKDV